METTTSTAVSSVGASNAMFTDMLLENVEALFRVMVALLRVGDIMAAKSVCEYIYLRISWSYYDLYSHCVTCRHHSP